MKKWEARKLFLVLQETQDEEVKRLLRSLLKSWNEDNLELRSRHICRVGDKLQRVFYRKELLYKTTKLTGRKVVRQVIVNGETIDRVVINR